MSSSLDRSYLQGNEFVARLDYLQGKLLIELNGSGGGARTPDPAVNSRLLYQLSYRGTREATGACLA